MATHRRTLTLILGLALLLLPFAGRAGAVETNAAPIIAELINPQKLATLGPRGANPRVQKCVYWLAIAQFEKQDPARVLDDAVKQAGYTNALAAQLTKESLVRNLKIAAGYGCLDAPGLADMRKGQAPTIQRGHYRGDQLSVDHIVPRAVCPELDHVIANLELMPLRRNESKNAKVAARQVQTAENLHRAGLLTASALAKVKHAAR